MIKQWDDSEILRLYSEGLSSYEVHAKLNPPITVRQVQRIIKKAGIARPRIKGRGGRLGGDGFCPLCGQKQVRRKLGN